MREYQIVTPPPDTVIWRYLDLSKLLGLLQDKQIVFARADKFKDQFEGQWSQATLRELQRLEDEGGTAQMIARQPLEVPKKTFVSCWHMSKTESAAMWGMYLSGPEGVAVRTTVGKLQRQLSPSPLRIVLGEVQYIDYVSKEMDHRSAFTPYFHKRESYEYEREVRAVMLNQPSGTHHIKVPEGAPVYGVPIDPAELIDSIIVSPGSGPWLRPLLSRVLQEQYGLTVEILDSTVDKGPAIP